MTMSRSLLLRAAAYVLLVGARGVCSFVGARSPLPHRSLIIASSSRDGEASSSSAFAVGTSELDDDLTEEEKTIINVYRTVGPSVAFVTSSIVNRRAGTFTGSASSNRPIDRRGERSMRPRSRRRQESPKNKEDDDSSNDDGSSDQRKSKKGIKPDGTSLGSGSAFCVSEDGYFVTNYHVIERAYQMSTVIGKYNSQIDQLVGNVTASLGTNPLLSALENTTKRALKVDDRPNDVSVLVRINSSTKYQPCRIVDVQPNLDVAVLKAELSKEERLAAVPYGSSSKLLVSSACSCSIS